MTRIYLCLAAVTLVLIVGCQGLTTEQQNEIVRQTQDIAKMVDPAVGAGGKIVLGASIVANVLTLISRYRKGEEVRAADQGTESLVKALDAAFIKSPEFNKLGDELWPKIDDRLT